MKEQVHRYIANPNFTNVIHMEYGVMDCKEYDAKLVVVRTVKRISPEEMTLLGLALPAE